MTVTVASGSLDPLTSGTARPVWTRLRLAMPPVLRVVLIAWLALTGGPVAAGDGVPPIEVAYFEDSTAKLTIGQVASADRQGRWTPSPSHMVGGGFSDSAWWVRFTIPPHAATLLIEIDRTWHSHLDFYRPRPDGTHEVTRSGHARPFSAREIAHRNPVFRVLPDANAQTQVYLRAEWRGAMTIPLRYWTEPGFAKAVADENLGFGASFGLIAVMVLYNLFVYFGVRDPAYLWYVVWFAGIGVNGLAHFGLSASWPVLGDPRYGILITYSSGIVGMAASMQFTRTIFDTARRTPRLDLALRVVFWCGWLAIPLSLAGALRSLSYLLYVEYLAVIVLGMVATAVFLRLRDRLAYYFLASFVLGWMAVVIGIARNFGWLSGDTIEMLTNQGARLSYSTHVIVIALALADRINVMKVDKERAQAEALRSQGLALDAARRSEAQLEQRVVERTEALAQARDEAQQANQAKTRFLAAASHDLRQPMHAIGLLVGALRDRVREPAARHLVDKIDGSVEAMDGLFNALLDISKLDSGSIVPKPVELRLQTVFDAIELAFASQAQAQGLRLRVRPCAALVRSDPVLLERILRNLVANAIRYTARGSVLVAARRHGEQLRIEVRDSGVGIPADKQALVFEEFVQLANPTRDRAKGLGLGLSIVQRLAALLQHETGLRSAPGRGSVFWVLVPGLGNARAVQAVPQDDVSAVDLSGAFVLVIDDEPDILEGMATLLGQSGARVACARSGHDALDVLREHLRAPDLVISDYRIAPDHTGVDAIGMVRAAHGAEIPALLITGDSSAEDLHAVHAAGLPVVFKPVSAARVRAMVVQAIGR